MSRLPLVVLTIALGTITLAADGDLERDQAIAPAQRGVLIEFEGEINSLSTSYLFRKLAKAEAMEADLVVVEFNSPGGDLEDSLAIAERLRDLPWARTVSYIPRQALSGAAIASLPCDEIVMAPNGLIGDAGPIFLDADFAFRHAPEKVRSHLVQQVRDLAQSAGRPATIAEAMVDMELIVYRTQNKDSGEVHYLSDAEIASDARPAQWDRQAPVHESRAGHFLEVNGTRAVELGLADANVADRQQLRARYQLKDDWIVMQRGTVDNFVLILNHPAVTAILFIVGLVALYVEFMAPGLGLGGVLCAICFALFFWSRFLGGTADLLEVLLFLVGIALLGVEVFVVPGFGVWGLTGVLAILASLILASQSFIVPDSGRQLTSLATGVVVVIGSMLVVTLTASLLTSRLGRIPGLSRLTLTPPVAETLSRSPSIPGLLEGARDSRRDSAMTSPLLPEHPLCVGDLGVAVSPLRPAGHARIADREYDVVTEGTFVSMGSAIRVLRLDGHRIIVRKIDKDPRD